MNYLDYLEVYADGSLREGKTDAGVFLADFNLKLLLRLSDGFSVLSAELKAIEMALNTLLQSLPPSKKVTQNLPSSWSQK